MFGSVTRASPTSAPPTTICSSPSGRPASRKTASNIAPPMTGVCGSGFRTTAFPSARAGATTRMPRTLGEFHGVIAPTTPTGIAPDHREPTLDGCRHERAVGLPRERGRGLRSRRRRSSTRGASCCERRPSRASSTRRTRRGSPRRSRRRGAGCGPAPGTRSRPRPAARPSPRRAARATSSGVEPRIVAMSRPVAGSRSSTRRTGARLPRRRGRIRASPVPRTPSCQVRSRPSVPPSVAWRRPSTRRRSTSVRRTSSAPRRPRLAAGRRVAPHRPAREHGVDQAFLEVHRVLPRAGSRSPPVRDSRSAPGRARRCSSRRR